MSYCDSFNLHHYHLGLIQINNMLALSMLSDEVRHYPAMLSGLSLATPALQVSTHSTLRVHSAVSNYRDYEKIRKSKEKIIRR